MIDRLMIVVTAGTLLTLSFITYSAPANIPHTAQQHHSMYAGEENRPIKSLSDDDIAQLTQGRGWGLAKAAELNGMPGPIHLLQMRNEIKLTTLQINQLEMLFNTMKQQAIPLGKQLIEREAQLNSAFANKTVTKKSLQKIMTDIATTYSRLRFTHLAAHLETPNILTPTQIKQYNALRGYQ